MPRKNRPLTPFVAIDGEAAENGDYFLLCANSDTKHGVRATLSNTSAGGLTSVECLEWLLDLKVAHPHSIFVGFAITYDVNQWLRSLPPSKLTYLQENGECYWLAPNEIGYRLQWIPGKSFSVATGTRYIEDDYRSVTVSDTFGFFQSRFVSAVSDWNIETSNMTAEIVERGKSERSSFKTDDIQYIARYCHAECRQLVKLMNACRDAFHEAGIRPVKWNGAGAAAAAVLKKEKVKDWHAGDETLPQPLRRAVMRAYFGGRSEVFWQGECGDCVGYDINSAYPAVAATLPPLNTGVWQAVRKYDPTAPWAVWHVVWECDTYAPVLPFPYREKNADIIYPYHGKGWYWQDEVRNAIALHGHDIRVTSGYVYHPRSDVLPFGFVPEYYALREQAKAAGHPKQKAYKLALNSLYGKLAQGKGYKDTVPWQRSYVWAGLITSGTRAELLRIATPAPERVVFMATDGIVFAKPAPYHPHVTGLGGLETTEYPNLFVAQSGIYCHDSENGQTLLKTRGFVSGDVDFDRLREGWRNNGPFYVDVTKARRFIGLGTALGRTDPPRWDVWRTWPETDRIISLFPARKYPEHEAMQIIEISTPGDGAVPHKIRWLAPPPRDATRDSYMYVPKTAILPPEADSDYIQGFEQPTPG